ncbi:MAG: protein phosphatase 2C domain-containing protein [Bacteroidota bacterium]
MKGWVTVDTLVLPKMGQDPTQCEDAVAVRTTERAVVVAVADGATEAAYSRAWAQELVQAASNLEEAGKLVEAVRQAQVPFSTRLEASQTDLPWYVAQKAQQGAYAALLRLRVKKHIDLDAGEEIGRGGAWHAEAVGDVTLFHLRASRLLRAWPNALPSDFGTRPDLIHSGAAGSLDRVQQLHGAWQPGDSLCLGTDAIAAHLLAGADRAVRFAARPRGDWATVIGKARAEGMKNDDVAFVRLTFEQP